MRAKIRITIEVLSPPLLGTLAFFVFHWNELVRLSSATVPTFVTYLAFAYAFALIPSAAYAALMEIWLRQYHRGALALLATVALSALFGFTAGWTIHLASEANVIEIGTMVGFVLGPVLYALAPLQPNLPDPAELVRS